MAKEFAKGFYNSKQWKKCREAYIAHRKAIDGGMCETCKISIHAPTRGATANIYKKITNFHIHLPHYITKKGGSPLLAQKNSIFNSLFNAKNSANLPAFLCLLPLRTIKLLSLPDQTCPSFHNAQLCSYSDFPDNKNANCLFPHQ